tara:strand:- start:418 stop:1077 length:660 start_codon:yes stop_codon:yes gene_type:complete
MGVFGTSNGAVMGAVTASNDQQFKNVSNLLSLQENHVEEFFQYHGKEFLSAMEKLIEDVVERAVSQMLTKLVFVQDSTSGNMKLQSGSLAEFEKITKENIELDLTRLLDSAINSEVINQRKMAKQQYLESQGFSSPQGGQQVGVGLAVAGLTGQTQQFQQMQGAANNGSGYPIPPNGTDGYGRPYWLDAQGQMSYEPPSSGLGLGGAIQKGAAWAKWLM